MKDTKQLHKVVIDPAKLKALRGSVQRSTIGEQIGVGATQVANYENGQRKPSANKLLRLMMLYNVRAEDLVGEAATVCPNK